MYVCVHMCVYIYIYIYMHVYEKYIYIYIYTYIYIYIYIYTSAAGAGPAVLAAPHGMGVLVARAPALNCMFDYMHCSLFVYSFEI